MSKFDINQIKCLFNHRFGVIALLASFIMMMPGFAKAEEHEEEGLDVKEIIFEHLGDGYGWEVPFSHTRRIPLPVIVRSQDGNWFTFSSADLTELVVEKNAKTGKTHEVRRPVIKTIERNGKTYQFILAEEGDHKDKVVEIFPMSNDEISELNSEFGVNKNAVDQDGDAAPEVADYVLYDGKYYKQSRPFDISITKNVAALFITVLIVIAMVF